MKYMAFISYRHSSFSRPHAEELERALKSYAKPLLQPPISIFRDERVLRPGDDLPTELRHGLEQSKYLIYLATAEAAESEWIQEELRIWCLDLKRADRLLIIHLNDRIVATPHGGIDWEKSNALPQQLKPFMAGTPVWHDLTWASLPEQRDLLNVEYRKVVNALVARFQDLDPGAMNDAEVLTHRRNIRLRNTAVVSIAVLACLATLFGYFSNRFATEAQRQAWHVERNQMRILSALSETSLREGRPVDAVKLAIAAWPGKAGTGFGNTTSERVFSNFANSLSRLWNRGSFQLPQVQSAVVALSNALPRMNQLSSVSAHKGAVRGVVFSPDGDRIVSTGTDGRIATWNARTGASIGEPVDGHIGAITAVTFSQDGNRLATGGQDGKIRIWDGSSITPIMPAISAEIGDVLSLAFSPDGSALVAGGSELTVGQWNLTSGERIPTDDIPHQSLVIDVDFFPDGSLVASSDNLGGVYIWDPKSGSLVGEPLDAAPRATDYFSILPNGKEIVTAGNDASLQLWDLGTRERKHFIDTNEGKHDGPVVSIDVSSNGSVFATGGLDGTIRLWSVVYGNLAAPPFMGHGGPVFSLDFAPDGKRLVSGGADGTVRVWEVGARGGPVIRRVPILYKYAFATSPNGQRYVGKNVDDELGIWDSETGTTGVPITIDDRFVNEYSFSQDSSRLIIDRWKFRIVDAETGDVIGKPMFGGPKHHCFVFNSTGDRIISCASEANLKMWDVYTGDLIWKANVPAESGAVVAAAFSPDDKTVVSGGEDGWLRFWNAEDGTELLAPQAAHQNTQFGSINSIDFSADGSLLVTGGADGSIRFWNPRKGTPIGNAILAHEAHGDARAKVSSDAVLVGSVGDDRLLKLWDVKTSIQIGTYGPVSEYDQILSFIVSEDKIATIILRSDVVEWDVSKLYGNLFKIACERLPYLSGKKDFSVSAAVLSVAIEIPDLANCEAYDPPDPWWTVPGATPPQPPE